MNTNNVGQDWAQNSTVPLNTICFEFDKEQIIMCDYTNEEGLDENNSEIDFIKKEITIEESQDVKNVTIPEFHDDDETPHKYNLCSSDFEAPQYLTQREVQKSQKDEKVACKLCDKIFRNVPLLKTHLITHSDERNFKCDQCEKTFKREGTLFKHKENIHTTKLSLQCEVCSKNFTNSRYLKKHLKNVHDDDYKFLMYGKDGKFHCKKCDKKFLTSCNLKRHLGTHSEEKNFKCDQCDKTFKQKELLSQHTKNMHATERLQCEMCSKIFRNAHYLKRHSKFVHEGGNKSDCKICSRRFRTPCDLKRHLRIHSDERNFKCDECDKAFKWKDALSLHKKYVHATERLFRCEVCSKNFTRAKYIKIHSKLFHDADHKLPEPGKGANFDCKICGKEFTKPSVLKQHLSTHSDERNFKCDQCDQSFKLKGKLSRHKRNVHATERLYKCEVCSKTFVSAEYLKDHVKNFHKINTSNAHNGGKQFNCILCPKKFKYKGNMDKHLKEKHKREDIETFEDAQVKGAETFDDVKVEPAMIYDSEEKRLIPNIKGEIEEEINLHLKQEPNESDES